MVRGKRFEVAVLGLGAMGAATLFQLSRRGVSAVGIDRFSPPHIHGSTHAETRITRLSVGEGDCYVPFAARSHEIWRALEAETGTDLLTQCGFLMVARPGLEAEHHGVRDFLGRTVDIARRHGIAHEVLDAAAVQARFPSLIANGNEQAYFEPEGGFVRPEACVAVQLRLAEAGGATVLRDTLALGVSARADGVVVETEAGPVEAAQLVVAAGAWTGRLLGPPYDQALVPFRQVLHWFPSTMPGLHEPDRMPVYIWVDERSPGNFFYGFPSLPGAREIKLGIEQYATPCDPDSVDRTVPAEDAAAVFAAHVAGRITGIAPAPARSTTCLYTVTPDQGFVIERVPGRERIVVMSPCSGHGFKHSAALGEAVAQWLVDGRSTISLLPFSTGRFAAIA